MKNTCHFISLQNLLLIILHISTYTSKFCSNVNSNINLRKKNGSYKKINFYNYKIVLQKEQWKHDEKKLSFFNSKKIQ